MSNIALVKGQAVRPSPVMSKPRWAIRAMLGAAVLATSACSGFLYEPRWTAHAPDTAWLKVTGAREAAIAAGISLEIPDVPYRLWFSDSAGQFFRASQPMKYKNTDGLVVAWEGGLYVRNDQPDQAIVWLSPLPAAGRPTLIAHPHWTVSVARLGPKK